MPFESGGRENAIVLRRPRADSRQTLRLGRDGGRGKRNAVRGASRRPSRDRLLRRRRAPARGRRRTWRGRRKTRVQEAHRRLSRRWGTPGDRRPGQGERAERGAPARRGGACCQRRPGGARRPASPGTSPRSSPPASTPAEAAAAITEGLILGSYRFDRFRSADPDDPPPPALDRIVFGGASDAAALGPAVNAARIAAEAQNHARDLQSLPANHATPTALAERASELAAAHESLTARDPRPRRDRREGNGRARRRLAGLLRGAPPDHAAPLRPRIG